MSGWERRLFCSELSRKDAKQLSSKMISWNQISAIIHLIFFAALRLCENY
jgi:hypothetical protein